MRFTAKEIDAVQFRYECPVCSKYVRKDGKPLVRPKRVMHAHGSNGEFHIAQQSGVQVFALWWWRDRNRDHGRDGKGLVPYQLVPIWRTY